MASATGRVRWKMIGYVQLYFKVVGEKEIYYAKFDGDFGKPLTRYRLFSVKRSIKSVYKEFDKIYSVDFISKEEWEENRSEDEISISWGKNGK